MSGLEANEQGSRTYGPGSDGVMAGVFLAALAPAPAASVPRPSPPAADADSTFVVIDGGGHGWAPESPQGRQAEAATLAFLDRRLKRPSR